MRIEHGFTLIEAIMTLVVLSIAAIGVLSVFSVGMKGSAAPLLTGQALFLAQGEMDQVLGEKAAGGFASVAIGNAQSCTSLVLPGFACSRTVFFVSPGDLNTPAAGPTLYKHVTVTITEAALGAVQVDTIIGSY